MKSIISSRSWHHSHLREDNGEKDAFENLKYVIYSYISFKSFDVMLFGLSSLSDKHN